MITFLFVVHLRHLQENRADYRLIMKASVSTRCGWPHAAEIHPLFSFLLPSYSSYSSNLHPIGPLKKGSFLLVRSPIFFARSALPVKT